MGKTNFTFVSPLRAALLMLVTFGLAGFNTVLAQCTAVPDVTITEVTTGTISVQVESGEDDDNHTFIIRLHKDQDGDPTTNDFFFYEEFLGVAGGADNTYTFGATVPLPCNSRYRVRVREYCDNLSGNSGWNPNPGESFNGADTGAGENPPALGIEVYTYSAMFPDGVADFISQSDDQLPTCPGAFDGCVTVDFEDVDYSCCENPEFEVTIEQDGDVLDTRTVTPDPADPAGDSYEVCGVGDGAVFGDLTVTIEETSGCTLEENPITGDVPVGEGVDTEDPFYYVTDIQGILLASNDPDADVNGPGPLADDYAGDTYDFGTLTLPEGECGRQDFFFVWAEDNCATTIDPFEGSLNDAGLEGLVTAVGTTLDPAFTLDPGTQAYVIYDGVPGVAARVDVHWSAGTSQVVITGCDLNDNCVDITLQANLEADEDDLQLVASPINAVIPTCEESTTYTLGVVLTGGCDATGADDFSTPGFTVFGDKVTSVTLTFADSGVDPDELTIISPIFADLASVSYFEYDVVVLPDADPFEDFINFTYQTNLGNFSFLSVAVNSQQASENLPAQIIASDDSYTIPYCNDQASIFYSFTVTDDCEAIDDTAVSASIDGNAVAVSAGQSCDGGAQCASYQITGNFDPGVYNLTINYGATSVTRVIDVDQASNQAPVVTLPGNLNVTIPPCTESVATTWAIQISDDCDGLVIDAANLEISVGGVTLDNNDTDQVAIADGYVEIYVDVTADSDGALLQASYTDSQGDDTTVSGELNILSTPDVIPPVVVYPSQDISVELDACDVGADATIVFEVSALDNCSGNITPDITVSGGANITITASPGGDSYTVVAAPGSYTVTITATDDDDNTTTEDFDINVSQDATPVDNLGCNGNLNITLGSTCEASATPDLLLEGSFGCLTDADFNIVVEDGDESNGGTIDGCGVFDYTITLATGSTAVNFTTCWGTLNVEDKEDPVIICPDDVSSLNVGAQLVSSFAGNLSTPDGFFQRPDGNFADGTCNPSGGFPTNDNVPYETQEFTVTSTGVYTFTASGDGDMYGFLATSDFDPTDPCDSWLVGNDDTAGGLDPELSFEFTAVLPAGSYTIVTTQYSNTSGVGAYVWDVTVPAGGGFLAEVALDLICDDIQVLRLDIPTSNIPDSYLVDANGNVISIDPALRRILDKTGYPDVSDNCGDLRVFVSDSFAGGGDCGDDVITRSFYAIDKMNGSPCAGDSNESLICTQVISSRKPTLGDVNTPLALVEIDCNDYAGADNPGPSITGWPSILTTLDNTDVDNDGDRCETAIRNLDDAYCNLGATYVDLPRITVCEGTYKFVREWTLLDWCEPNNIVTYRQVIKVGDYDGPEIEVPTADYDWDGVNDVLRYSTAPNDCVAYIPAPSANVTDDCSGAAGLVVSVWTAEDGQIWVGNVGQIASAPAGLAPGDYIWQWCATDGCGNETCETAPFVVRDLIAPSAVCDDELNVSIGGGDIHNGIYGETRITAEDVDEGSNDNCGDVRIEVRRNNWNQSTGTCGNSWSAWGPYVDFHCCDIDNEITIELRVWDDANGDGVIGGPGDLSNVCWLVVTPEDKLNPYCYPPHDQTLACTELPLYFPTDLQEAYDSDFAETSTWMNAIFGEAWGTDNCAVDTIVERSPQINLSDCGWGTITRRFEAWQLEPGADVSDGIQINEVRRSSNTCTQTITITEVHDYYIEFPEDADADCGDPNIPEVNTNDYGCDVLAVNTADPERFDATGDECYKLRIVHTVINWCLWDGESEPIVVARDTGNDADVDCNENPIIHGRGTSAASVVASIDRSHSCNDEEETNNNTFADRGYWQYTQFVKVYDSSEPVITVGEFGGPTEECPDLVAGQFGSIDNVNCTAPVSITFSVADDCELFNADGDLVVDLVDAHLDAFAFDANADGQVKANEFVADVTVTGNVQNNGNGTFTFTFNAPIIYSTSGPNIWHALRVRVEDGCGNQTSEIIEFDVVDCKAPTPIVINGLAVTVMPQPTGPCTMEIWVSDFIASPITDCSGPDPMRYAIYRQDFVDAQGPNWAPNPSVTNLVLTEDDGFVIVYIYAIDGEGNFDYTETYVEVSAHASCAGGGGSLSGVIATPEDETVENVEVNLSGGSVNSMTTLANGAYTFDNLDLGMDYTVTPFLNAEPLNGVSTFDLVLMSKHILGVDLLNSPYEMIAADVNNSQTITTLDMIQLRRLILNIYTEFSNNTSWRFVDASYVFPDPSNPWLETFPEVVNENNLQGEIEDLDFVAVKIGDVNGNATANFLSTDDRNLNGTFNFNVADAELKAGNVYTVEFTGADMAAVEGYQLTLALNGADLVDVVYGAATEDHFGMRFADEGMITTSWNGKASSEDVLFSLVISANADAMLSEVLGVSSRYTLAEAYNTNGSTMGVGIEFNTGAVVSAGFEVYQNTPNPFKGETLIGFNLPQDAQATITINDVTGRVVTMIRQDGAAGYNTVNVTRDMLNGATGVLSYTVTAGDYTATKKMIVVE